MSPGRDVPSDTRRFADVGLQFSVTIGVFAGLGYWIDGRLGTGPWLLIVGVFLGFGLGLTSMVSKLGPRATTTQRKPRSHRDGASPPDPKPPASDDAPR